MRKVILRWKIPSLRGAKELSRFLEVAERVEVLGHLAVSTEGVTQLVEIKMRDGHSVEEISDFDRSLSSTRRILTGSSSAYCARIRWRYPPSRCLTSTCNLPMG